MQLELISPEGDHVADVFQDESTGARSFNGLDYDGPVRVSLPLEVLHWFLDEADKRLALDQ